MGRFTEVSLLPHLKTSVVSPLLRLTRMEQLEPFAPAFPRAIVTSFSCSPQRNDNTALCAGSYFTFAILQLVPGVPLPTFLRKRCGAAAITNNVRPTLAITATKKVST